MISHHEIGNFLQLSQKQGQPVNTIGVYTILYYYLHFLWAEEKNKYGIRVSDADAYIMMICA